MFNSLISSMSLARNEESILKRCFNLVTINAQFQLLVLNMLQEIWRGLPPLCDTPICREFRTPDPSLFKRGDFISAHKIQERCAKGCLIFHGKPTDFRALRGFNRSLSKSPADVQENTLTKMNWILSSQIFEGSACPIWFPHCVLPQFSIQAFLSATIV